MSDAKETAPAPVVITNQADAMVAAQQQYQLQDQQQQTADNVDDTRFVMPSAPPFAAAAAVQQGSAAASVVTGSAATAAKGAELVYQEVSFVNTSTSEGFTIPNNEEKDLETRLKYVGLT